MARNLRNKIPESDTMIVHDTNPAVCEEFKNEVGRVQLVDNVRDLAERSVRITTHQLRLPF